MTYFAVFVWLSGMFTARRGEEKELIPLPIHVGMGCQLQILLLLGSVL